MTEAAKDKRDALLQTALTLFTERGFYGTPTSQISREAGVATGTLFFYFKTKEELIDTLYRDIKAEAGMALRQGIDKESTIERRLRRVCINFIGWGTKNPAKMQFMEQFEHSSFVSRCAHDEGMLNFTFLYGIVDEGIRKGIIKNFSTDLIFHYLASSGSGVIGLIQKTSNPEERKALTEQALDLLWNGLGTQ